MNLCKAFPFPTIAHALRCFVKTPRKRPISNEWWKATKTAAWGLLIAAGVHTFVAEVRYIPSESMTPTLEVGDRLIIEKLSYRLHSPQRGDMVVFAAPPDLKARNITEDMIKRVVGLPGEVVAVQNGQLEVNGQAIVEPYIKLPATYHFNPVRVPENHYFVLGDNRNHSYDSHLWGFLPQQNLIGHAVFRFYPLQRLQPL